MSKSAAASGSFSACAALSYERVIPQVSGSLRMNFIAFGFGVGSISAILGIVWSLLFFALGDAARRRFVHRIVVGFGRRRSDRIERRVQRVPRQNRALDAGRQVFHAGENGQPPEVMRLRGGVELARRHVAELADE